MANVPNIAPFRFPPIKEWCAQVIVEPLDNRIIVFKSGSSKGLTGSTPTGGQVQPNSHEGVNELWKYAQKTDRKNKASDTTNSMNPRVNPLWTEMVWSPKKVN